MKGDIKATYWNTISSHHLPSNAKSNSWNSLIRYKFSPSLWMIFFSNEVLNQQSHGGISRYIALKHGWKTKLKSSHCMHSSKFLLSLIDLVIASLFLVSYASCLLRLLHYLFPSVPTFLGIRNRPLDGLHTRVPRILYPNCIVLCYGGVLLVPQKLLISQRPFLYYSSVSWG